MSGLRIDKWLRAARFFKTRTLATAACDAGRVSCNQQPAKPSRILKLGDRLQIAAESGDYTVEVLELSDQRASAAIAQTLYSESDASRDLRAQVAAARKLAHANDPIPARRPSKRDRRLIHSFRGH